MNDKVSIVIPNYNRWDLCHTLLFDLYKHCAFIDEIIVVNDGCTQAESFAGLQWWRETQILPVRELRIEENVGFLLASNMGMKDATGDIIVLISNDVRVMGDIVVRIRHIIKNTSEVLIGGRVLNWDTGWNTFDGELYEYVEGWLLAAHKDGWKKLNYFDERYAPNDFEDIDISTNAISSGYKLVSLPEDLTFHLPGQTLQYTPKREVVTKINREKFREKWITQSSK